MAFNNSAATVSNLPEKEKAEAFANVYAPVKGGSRRKWVGIPLRRSNPLESMILDRMGDEAALQSFFDSLIFEIVSATPAKFELDC